MYRFQTAYGLNNKIQNMKKLLITIVAFSFFVNAWSQQKFPGPINSVFAGGKIAWIYPTSDRDTATLNLLKNYVSEVFNHFKKEGCILIPDSTALSRPLSDYGLLIYGTIESNLFLKHYKLFFPFKIENDIIYADKEYKDKNTRFITCLPNPQNPVKGIIIYTSTKNKNIVGINGVYHGPTDFVVSIHPSGDDLRQTYSETDNLSQGYYDKTDNRWKFEK